MTDRVNRPESPDDVVIVSAVRTAVARGKKDGALASTHPVELSALVMKEALDRAAAGFRRARARGGANATGICPAAAEMAISKTFLAVSTAMVTFAHGMGSFRHGS